MIGAWTVRDFAVLDVIGTGRQVVAEVRAAFDLPDGGRFADEEIHLWTFDDARAGRPLPPLRDTAKHIAADRGEDTTRLADPPFPTRRVLIPGTASLRFQYGEFPLRHGVPRHPHATPTGDPRQRPGQASGHPAPPVARSAPALGRRRCRYSPS